MKPASFFKSPLTKTIQDQYIAHCKKQLSDKQCYLDLAQAAHQRSAHLIKTIQQCIAEEKTDLELIEHELRTTRPGSIDKTKLHAMKKQKQTNIQHHTKKLKPFLENMIQLERSIHQLKIELSQMTEDIKAMIR